MKKFLIFSLITVSLNLTSCRLGTISNINSGVKVITKCCKDISDVSKGGYDIIKKAEIKTEETSNSKGLLPTYSWDAKQMLW